MAQYALTNAPVSQGFQAGLQLQVGLSGSSYLRVHLHYAISPCYLLRTTWYAPKPISNSDESPPRITTMLTNLSSRNKNNASAASLPVLHEVKAWGSSLWHSADTRRWWDVTILVEKTSELHCCGITANKQKTTYCRYIRHHCNMPTNMPAIYQ